MMVCWRLALAKDAVRAPATSGRSLVRSARCAEVRLSCQAWLGAGTTSFSITSVATSGRDEDRAARTASLCRPATPNRKERRPPEATTSSASTWRRRSPASWRKNAVTASLSTSRGQVSRYHMDGGSTLGCCSARPPAATPAPSRAISASCSSLTRLPHREAGLLPWAASALRLEPAHQPPAVPQPRQARRMPGLPDSRRADSSSRTESRSGEYLSSLSLLTPFRPSHHVMHKRITLSQVHYAMRVRISQGSL